VNKTQVKGAEVDQERVLGCEMGETLNFGWKVRGNVEFWVESKGKRLILNRNDLFSSLFPWTSLPDVEMSLHNANPSWVRGGRVHEWLLR
jgi:hypothetical protein